MKRPIMLALVLLALASPARATTIFFSPSSLTATVGGDVFVDLEISGLGDGSAPSVGVFDLDITFSEAILSFQDLTWGSGLDVLGLGSLQAATLGIGTVNLFELSFDSVIDLNALQPSAFTLATLRFLALGTGESGLGLSVNSLGDADGNSIDAALGTARVNVVRDTPVNVRDTPVPLPVLTTMTLVGLGLFSRARSNRKKTR